MRLAWPSRRQTNLLLLAAVVSALVSGTWLFASGGSAARAVAVVHGSVGLLVVVLSPRKRQTVTRGLARARSTRALSLLLLSAVLVTVATGIGHAAGWRTIASYPLMHVHVIAAITCGVLVIWHALARPARPVRTDFGRRGALRAGVVAGSSLLAWVGLESVAAGMGLRGAARRGTGSHERSSFEPDGLPGTIWLFDSVPALDPLSHAANIGGRALTAADVGTPTTSTVTLDCTSGWYSTQRWGGAALSELLGPPPAGAGSILVRAISGYSRRFPVAERDRLLVATSVGGAPLAARHGGPIRLVAPGRRGFWWVKWVSEIRYDDAPAWAQPPFPLR